MGNCAGASSVTGLVPSLQSSLVHLLMLNETDLIILKIRLQNIPINQPINFRNDTLLHYAAAKQNIPLINFLLSQKELKVCQKNSMGLMPKDLVKNVEIKKMFA